MSKTLDSLATNIVLDVDLRNGEIRDRSAYNQTMSVYMPANLRWVVSKGCRGINFTYGKIGLVQAAAAVSLRVTQGVLIVFGSPITRSDYIQAFMDLSKTAGTRLLLWSTNGTNICLSAGATNSLLEVGGLTGRRFIAVRFSSGTQPSFFIDGAPKGLGVNVLNILAGPDADCYLGGNGAAVGQSCQVGMKYVILNSAGVTDAQISAIYAELMNERGNLVPELRNLVYPYPKVLAPETRPLIEYDCESRNGAKLANLGSAGATYDGTAVGGPIQVKGAFDKAFDSYDRSYYQTGNVTQLNAATKYTAEFVCNLRTDVNKYVWSHGFDANNRIGVGMGVGSILVVAATGVVAVASCATTAMTKGHCHVRVEYDGTQTDADIPTQNGKRLKLYINNVMMVLSWLYNPIPAALYAGNVPLYLGGDRGLTTLDGNVSYFRLWVATVPTAAENARHYQQFQRLLRYKLDMTAVPVTLANVMTGQQIPGTQLQVDSGTVQVVQDATTPYRKWLASTAISNVSMQSSPAYGTWYFRFKQGVVSNSIIGLIANKRGSYDAAGQTGYIFVTVTDGSLVLYRHLAGGLVSLMATAAGYAATATEYQGALTRSKLGVFTLYIKGGAFATWTLVNVVGGSGTNPVTDTTYSASGFINYNPLGVNNLSKFGSVYVFEEPIDPTIAADGQFIDSLG